MGTRGEQSPKQISEEPGSRERTRRRGGWLQVGDWEVRRRRSYRSLDYLLESRKGGRELVAGGSRDRVRNY